MRVEHIAWVTGEQSPNRTRSEAGVFGTDLGILWDDGRGGVLAAFGDTFGGAHGRDWRSNVLAHSSARDLSEGMLFDGWVQDRPGHAGQVLASDPGVDECTIIPTAGISVGTRNYLTYMSICQWGEPGRWSTNYAGIAHSDDGGQHWIKSATARWPNTPDGAQGWQMCALTRFEGFVYIFGTPNGRAGPAYLARAPERALLDLDQHQQWAGDGWTTDPVEAVPLLDSPVSELSVMHHRHSNQWLAAYYSEQADAIVVHTAGHPTGPWSRPQAVAFARDWPGLYGAFFHPWTADEPSPCFAMSQWEPYNVMLMRLV